VCRLAAAAAAAAPMLLRMVAVMGLARGCCLGWLNLSGEGNGGRVRYGAQVSDRWIGLTAQDLRLMIFFFEKYKINVPGSVKVNQFFTSHYFSQCKWFPVLKHTPFFSSYKSF
jgi:hypothetical protein